MAKKELVTEIIRLLKLPDTLGTTIEVEKKLNELIDEFGGSINDKY